MRQLRSAVAVNVPTCSNLLTSFISSAWGSSSQYGRVRNASQAVRQVSWGHGRWCTYWADSGEYSKAIIMKMDFGVKLLSPDNSWISRKDKVRSSKET